MEQSGTPAGTQAAPAKKGRGMMYGILAVVIIVIVIGAAYYYYSMPATPVDVSIIDANGSCPVNDTNACKFSPTPFNTTSGKQVTWKNTGQTDHTVHFFSNSTATPPTNSTSIAAGLTFKATFGSAGTFYYYCDIHPWMHGTVNVT